MAGHTGASSGLARKPKASASKPKPASKPFRSEEFVVDSDDSEITGPKPWKSQTAKAVPSAPVFTEPAHPNVTGSVSKPSRKRKVPTPIRPKEASSPDGSEEERERESESESENGGNSGKEADQKAQDGSPTPARPKQSSARIIQTKPLPNASVAKPQLKRSNQNVSIQNSTNSRLSRSEGDSNSSESGSGSDTGSSNPTSLQSPSKRSPTRNPAPAPVQTFEPYGPPPKFNAAFIAAHSSSQNTEIFSPTNLAGKEVWHITVPASVPIGLIKEIPTRSTQSQTPILSHKDADYILIQELGSDETNNCAVLLPSAQANVYEPSKSAISKTLHLQQLMSLPFHTASPASPPIQTVAVPEPRRRVPRQQPPGLKMRYHPYGVSDESESESPPSNVAQAPTFRAPRPGQEDSLARKRKRSELDNGNQITYVPPSEIETKKQKNRPEVAVEEAEGALDLDKTKGQAPKEQEIFSRKIQGLRDGISDADNPNSAKPERKKEKQKDNKKTPSAPVSALPAQIVEEAETIIPGEVVNGASAVDIPDAKQKKALRKEEKRRRKEAAKVAEQESLNRRTVKQDKSFGDAALRARQDDVIRKADNQSREQSIHLPTPRHSSPQKQQRTANGSLDLIQASTQVASSSSSRSETKEERAKRKEEKRRRRRIEMRSA